MEDFPVADSFSLPCETQRLDGEIQPEFASVFEADPDLFLGASRPPASDGR
jgi:hypothetical protein